MSSLEVLQPVTRRYVDQILLLLVFHSSDSRRKQLGAEEGRSDILYRQWNGSRSVFNQLLVETPIDS